ncbi:MAG: hypothetical protein CL424_16370 [Acidimicrobiaceae bacterium]|nr:hypothetical protein [Acidimicrobiaceae bacterium]
MLLGLHGHSLVASTPASHLPRRTSTGTTGESTGETTDAFGRCVRSMRLAGGGVGNRRSMADHVSSTRRDAAPTESANSTNGRNPWTRVLGIVALGSIAAAAQAARRGRPPVSDAGTAGRATAPETPVSTTPGSPPRPDDVFDDGVAA